MADFSFLECLFPHSHTYGQVLSTDRSGVAASQFRVAMFPDGRIGVSTDGLSCHTNQLPFPRAYDANRYGPPCTTSDLVPLRVGTHFRARTLGHWSGRFILMAPLSCRVVSSVVADLVPTACSLFIGSRFPQPNEAAPENAFDGTITHAVLRTAAM